MGAFDPFDARKVHREPVPRLGGIGIIGGLLAGVLTVGFIGGFEPLFADRAIIAILGGTLGMHLLGIVDDLFPTRARHKLLVQVGVAAASVWVGLGIESLSLPIVGNVALAPWVGALLSVVWLVGLTNALNLIDGLDGLAAGVALFALFALAALALVNGQNTVAILAVLTAGATLGFLRHNAPPATIFLGDSGSLSLGFMLAALGLVASRQADGSLALLTPLVALGVPVTDTAVAIVRRFLGRRPIFAPDRDHIHHRLLARGHSSERVVHLLYFAAAVSALAALILALDGDRFLIFTLFAVLCMGFFVHHLRFHEFQEVARLLQRGSNPRSVIGRNVRFREAGARLAAPEEGSEIVAILDRAFAGDPIARAELRLQRSFLHHTLVIVDLNGRIDDEVVVWHHGNVVEVPARAWEVAIPLCSEDGMRFGSLVLWEGSSHLTPSVSHLQVIAASLCPELERRLRAMGWTTLASPGDVAVSAVPEQHPPMSAGGSA